MSYKYLQIYYLSNKITTNTYKYDNFITYMLQKLTHLLILNYRLKATTK
jgi:hypothetical protein